MPIPRGPFVSLLGLALIAASCGGGGTNTEGPAVGVSDPATVTTTTSSIPATDPPATTTGDSPATTEATPPEPDHDRPDAPDFTLDLADGTTFVLSEETRPVYLVFWAEW